MAGRSSKRGDDARKRRGQNVPKKWMSQVHRLFRFVFSNNQLSLENISSARMHLSAMCLKLSTQTDEENNALDQDSNACVSIYPPKFDPQLWEAMQQDNQSSSTEILHSNGTNRFSYFEGSDEDDEEEKYPRRQQRKKPSSDLPQRPFNFQWRYLISELYVYEGEYCVRAAEFHAHELQWTICGEMATEGYNKINAVLIQIDSWFAFCAEHPEEHHDHRLEQLESIVSCTHMSRNHSNDVAQRILHEGERRRGQLLRKLTPEWRSRDAAKSRMGVKQWKENPNPSRAYAVKRQAMEEELKALELNMSIVTELLAK